MQGSNGEKYIVLKIYNSEPANERAGENPVSAEFDGDCLTLHQADGSSKVVVTTNSEFYTDDRSDETED